MNLQAELDVVQQQIYDEKQKLGQKDMDRIAELEKQEADLLERIMNAQVEQNHETRLQQTQEQITYLMDSLEVDGIRIRNLCISDSAYELLRASVEDAVIKKVINPLTDQIKGGEEREQQLQRQNDRMQETVKQRDLTITAISEELNKSKFETEHANQKRDAAVRAAEQSDELLRLKQEELDLERTEKVLGAREAYKVIDASEQIKQLAENFRKSQIKVTNIRWEDDIKKTFKLAELAENGETIRFHYFEQGKYLEVTVEEALQFRLELQANSPIPNLPLVEIALPSVEIVTPVQFREGADDLEEPSTGTNDGAGTDAEPVGLGHDPQVLASKVATLESTVNALTADVEALKRKMAA